MKALKKQYPKKQDRLDAFNQFKLEAGISDGDFPFEYVREVAGLHKPYEYQVSGFGGYTTTVNEWRVFIAYRMIGGDHVIQHSWRWDAEAQLPCEYKKDEFIQ